MIHVDNLTIGFPSQTGSIQPVIRDVSLRVGSNERVGLVGESGSGKSLLALACLGLVPEPGQVLGGSVTINGVDLATASAADLQQTRGGRIGIVFQEAAASLNPVYTIGFQLAETIRTHHGVSRAEGMRRAETLLGEVAIENAPGLYGAYPHELSGGQAQRVMIALALAGEPDVLIADEATSALDVVTQAEILELLEGLTRKRGMGILLISHDLMVVRRLVERTCVLFAGEIVEEGPTSELFANPLHPYTKMLLTSAPGKRDSEAGREFDLTPIPPAAEFGCPFNPRCRLARSTCRESAPPLVAVAGRRLVRCPVAVESLLEGSNELR